MKLISTAAASAVLFALSVPAAVPADAESVTLKRTGALARSDRARSAEEEGAPEDSAALEDATPQADESAESGSGGWADSGDDHVQADSENARDTRAATRRLIIVGDGTQRNRYKRRRHCVESTWSSCGERQRTLWIFN